MLEAPAPIATPRLAECDRAPVWLSWIVVVVEVVNVIDLAVELMVRLVIELMLGVVVELGLASVFDDVEFRSSMTLTIPIIRWQ